MTKNGMIRVFDENGNEIGQTYPKRVNGLIKKGRARFTDESETAIVLTDAEPKIEDTEACPPNNLTLSEDMKMAEHTATTVCENNSEAMNHTATATAGNAYDATGAMPEELRRLYDKLDEIDKEIYELRDWIGEVSTEALGVQLAQLDKMRNVTLALIEDFKKKVKPKVVNIEESIYKAQLDVLLKLMKEKEEELAERLTNDEDFTVTDYETLTAALDARFSKRMNELINNIANAGKEKAETADNANE